MCHHPELNSLSNLIASVTYRPSSNSPPTLTSVGSLCRYCHCSTDLTRITSHTQSKAIAIVSQLKSQELFPPYNLLLNGEFADAFLQSLLSVPF